MSARLTLPVGPDDHTAGPDDAPVTLVEYGDYECPYCGLAQPIVGSVREHFGDRLRFVFRHFPLSQVHPHAEHAAEMAEVAGAAGRFWPMHELLFANQHALDDANLVRMAASLGVDPTAATTALRNHAFAGRVRADFLSGVRSGVNGTPTFFINGVRHDGGWDQATLIDAIETAAYAAPH